MLPFRYESVIATLCENLDSLDEPEARAAMIWIVGEYAERIDNADELLESFLEGFHDESTQVGWREWPVYLQGSPSHLALNPCDSVSVFMCANNLNFSFFLSFRCSCSFWQR